VCVGASAVDGCFGRPDQMAGARTTTDYWWWKQQQQQQQQQQPASAGDGQASL
jgi:hypothetical protein